MRALILLRHSLTEANERRLYYGWTDLALSSAGRRLARETAARRPLPTPELCVTSGMRRANETLMLLTGRTPDAVIPALKEMNFGAFEMRGHWSLERETDYRRWLTGRMDGVDIAPPGGESPRQFHARALRGGEALLAMAWQSALAVVHGGTIVHLMAEWFPGEGKGFYDWQPGPCEGYRVAFDGRTPVGYEAI